RQFSDEIADRVQGVVVILPTFGEPPGECTHSRPVRVAETDVPFAVKSLGDSLHIHNDCAEVVHRTTRPGLNRLLTDLKATNQPAELREGAPRSRRIQLSLDPSDEVTAFSQTRVETPLRTAAEAHTNIAHDVVDRRSHMVTALSFCPQIWADNLIE